MLKMFNIIIPDSLGVLFWDANLEKKHIDMYLKNAPKFWKEICYHWFDFQRRTEFASQTDDLV